MESLTGIVAFVRAAETLSFVAAGRQLGISASAVGKNIAKLEESLGVRLFHRTTRRISLTQEGTLFLDRCRSLLEGLHDAQAMLSRAAQAPRGRLRVSLPTVGYRFLLPILPEFKRLYPGVELDLDFSDRIVDIVEEGFDAVIRSGALTDSSLMSRRLGPFRFVLCASPRYLESHGTPLAPKDLAGHKGLHFRIPTTGRLQEWALARESAVVSLSVLTCNNMEAVRVAAIGGLGIAYMPDFLARDAIESGRLSTVLDEYAVDSGQFHILWPSSRQLSARLRVFVDFVAERLFART